MPNWCSNVLALEGNFNNFDKQIKSCIKNGKDMAICKNGMVMFDLYRSEYGIYQFESRWSPPIEDLLKSAKKSGFSLELEYSEPGCLLFGKFNYCHLNGTITEWIVPDDKFSNIEYNDDGTVTDSDGQTMHEYEFIENNYELLIN